MNVSSEPWAVVLAAGSGLRLQALTKGADGSAVPKQFCSLAGGRTLFEDTVARAARVAPCARVATIVAAEHRRWWSPLCEALSARNVIAQPRNRGTALGVILTCLHLAAREPDARVVMLPSDHFVHDEARLTGAVTRALQHVDAEPEATVLVGVSPEEADPELGYIVPLGARGRAVSRVARFVEKPTPDVAARLIAEGALWNSFIVVGRVATLLALCERSHASTVATMRAALHRDGWALRDGSSLARAYARLPDLDFSRHVLAGNEPGLRVVSAPCCGWTDLGTPGRVVRCLESLGVRRAAPRNPPHAAGPVHPNLVHACASYRLSA